MQNAISDATPAPPPAPRVEHSEALGLVEGLFPKALPAPGVAGWELAGVLGQGGLGTVWRARRLSDGAAGAVKVSKGEDLDELERIEDEAKSLRSLDHPGIVRLLDSGETRDGGLFLVMEYIDGPSLAQCIPLAGMPPEQAFAIFRQVAAAVQHAHDRGVIHRDLKPGNILIGSDGAAHVADFGLARPVHERVLQLSLTSTGNVSGTAEYLPPEAYRANYKPDFRGDVYALGVVLYEMLAGAPPRGAWEPVSERRHVDIRVDEVLRRALSPDARQRWQTPAAMSAALEEIHRTVPRYSGTPLQTPAVRAMDFAWTIVALLVHVALIGGVLRLVKSNIVWPVDLIGAEELKTGGFQALVITLMAMVPVAMWQLVRLWRFRNVPLREALPVPFGLRLGGSRTAAAMVVAGQLLCIVAPTILAWRTWHHCARRWSVPQMGAFHSGLLVTIADGARPIAPWDFPPEGESTWLNSYAGYPGEPGSRLLGRVSFVPGAPHAMAGAALLLLAALYAPAVALARRQLRGGFAKSVPLTLALAASLGGGASIYKEYLRYAGDIPRSDLPSGADKIEDLGKWRYLTPWENVDEPPPGVLNKYDASVDYRDAGVLPLAEVKTRVVEEEKAARLLNTAREYLGKGQWLLSDALVPPLAPASTAMWTEAVCIGEFTTPSAMEDGRLPLATGGIFVLITQRQTRNEAKFTAERMVRKQLYAAEQRRITPAEADEWVKRMLNATFTLEVGMLVGADPLEHFLLPTLFSYTEGDKRPERELAARERSAVIEMMRTSREHFRTHYIAPPSSLEYLPGARNRVTFPVHYNHGKRENWRADLVFSEGRWQCVRLDFNVG